MLTDADFQRALQVILKNEGGYVNNPKDPGGATNFGITQRTYDGWRERQGLGTQPVRGITGSEVSRIYRTDYWDASRAATLPYDLALVHFDTAVNMGVGAAQQILAQAKGDVARYLAFRRARYESIAAARPDSAGFLPGWLKRVDSLAASVGTKGGVTLALLALLAGVWWLLRRSKGVGLA